MRKGSIIAVQQVALAVLLLLGVSAGVFAQSKVKMVTQDIRVVVNQGDNLSEIVKRVMGSAEYWEEVAALNKMARPNALKPGQVIVFPSELVQERNYARVVFTKGDTQLTRLGSSTSNPLQKGERVFIGDVVATGSDGFVSLSFEGESFINVQPDSLIQIIEFDCFDKEKSCVVNLLTGEGQMGFDIKNIGFSKPPRFSIETPYASAAVRGTRFDVDVVEGSILGVTEGAVQVSAGELSTEVPLGKGTLAGEGRSITTLYDLLLAPQYRQFIRLSAEDYLSWAPVENSSSYKYALAGNASLSDVIAAGTTPDAFLPMPADSESFYLSTRALDENGLKGFRALQQVNLVPIDETLEAPLLEIELAENQLTIVNTGDLLSEIHIGQKLEPVGDLPQLIEFDAYDIEAGGTLELTVDTANDIYVASRAVIGRTAVSPYGNIYEFKQSTR
ncbi:MAG: FecR domain-containing protein [Pseudomonadota bacterium]